MMMTILPLTDCFGFNHACPAIGERLAPQLTDRTATQPYSTPQAQRAAQASEQFVEIAQFDQEQPHLLPQEPQQDATNPAPGHSLALQAYQYGRS